MKFDEFTKARLKITLFISVVATIILSAFGGTVYYFYKEQIVYETSDYLKSLAFKVAREIEKPFITPAYVLEKINLPDDTFICIYNKTTGTFSYKGKMCNVKEFFEGFRVYDDNVIYGLRVNKNFDEIYIFVGKSLKRILLNLYTLKAITFYVFFVISVAILIFAFYISKYILKPLKDAVQKQEEFIQNVSHDLKTPISVILSNLYLIKQKNYRNIEKNISTVEKHTTNMQKIINDMLFITKIGVKKHKEDIDVNQLIKEVLYEFESLINEKNINLKVNEKGSITVEANKEELKKLFVNLIENAIKYNKENGFIEINISDNTVSIKNSGRRIKPEERKKIFERFYRGDCARSTEGTGLGLAIVKEISKKYGIKVSLNSTDDYNEFVLKFK